MNRLQVTWTVSRRAYARCAVLFLSVFAAFLLIGPRVPNEQAAMECVQNVDLPGPFGLSLNGDSPDFLLVAIDPARMLGDKKLRQSRPGMIFAAHVLSRPLVLLFRWAENLPQDLIPFDKVFAHELNGRPFGEILPAYMAYVALNMLLLLLAARLFLSLVARRDDPVIPVILVPMCVVLVANDVTKAFLFSPHTQLFNILVPILCIWCGLRSWEDRIVYQNEVYAWSVLWGLGLLAYGSFIVIMPFLLLPSLLRDPRRTFVPRAAGATILFALPMLTWYLFVHYKTGGFYQHEMEQSRQLVWMKDVNGGFAIITHVLHNFTEIVANFQRSNTGWMILTAGALIASLGARLLEDRDKLIICLALVTSLSMAIFFSIIGLLAWRVAYTMAPGLWVALAIVLRRANERWRAAGKFLAVFSGIAMLIWAAHVIVKYGPNA